MTGSVGIFFSSDTGNTEKVAKMIQQQIGLNVADIFDIAVTDKDDLKKYNNLLFGIPTWYYGEAQCDWDDFFPSLEKINFTGKKVGIFGCGDQEDYAEYFCDAMNAIRNITEKNGAKLVGQWPITGYYFESSKSVIENNHFVGLAIDEDRQPEMTYDRVKTWVKQICQEMDLVFRDDEHA